MASGRKDAARSIRRIFAFLTLTTTLLSRHPRLPAYPIHPVSASVHRHVDARTSFFTTRPRWNEAALVSPPQSSLTRLVSPCETIRDEDRVMKTKRLRDNDNDDDDDDDDDINNVDENDDNNDEDTNHERTVCSRGTRAAQRSFFIGQRVDEPRRVKRNS